MQGGLTAVLQLAMGDESAVTHQQDALKPGCGCHVHERKVGGILVNVSGSY